MTLHRYWILLSTTRVFPRKRRQDKKRGERKRLPASAELCTRDTHTALQPDNPSLDQHQALEEPTAARCRVWSTGSASRFKLTSDIFPSALLLSWLCLCSSLRNKHGSQLNPYNIRAFQSLSPKKQKKDTPIFLFLSLQFATHKLASSI